MSTPRQSAINADKLHSAPSCDEWGGVGEDTAACMLTTSQKAKMHLNRESFRTMLSTCGNLVMRQPYESTDEVDNANLDECCLT